MEQIERLKKIALFSLVLLAAIVAPRLDIDVAGYQYGSAFVNWALTDTYISGPPGLFPDYRQRSVSAHTEPEPVSISIRVPVLQKK